MDSNHTGAKSPAKKRGGRSARRRSREFALQGVYQWLMSHTDPEAIDAAALEAEDFDKADQAFYRELLHGVTEEFPSLEASYAPHIDREVTSLSPIERAILLIGTYELKNTTTPYRVVINEAVELAKSFGGSDGFKYVNGVLDKMVPELRPYEVVKAKMPEHPACTKTRIRLTNSESYPVFYGSLFLSVCVAFTRRRGRLCVS